MVRLHTGIDIAPRQMRRPPGSEPLAVFTEGGALTLLQHLQRRLRHESIHHRRNAELPGASSRFRYLHPPRRLWPISTCYKLLLHSWPILRQEARQFFHRYSVNSCNSRVGFHAPQRFLQILLLARLLDQLVPVRLAFRTEFRRREFSSFIRRCPWGFTPRVTFKGQFIPDFLPLLHFESLPVLPFPPFGPSGERHCYALCSLLTDGQDSSRSPKTRFRDTG